MCISPITMRHPVTGKVVTFPCGKCCDCISKYQNDWTFRLSREYNCWKHAFFITMTYSDNNLPYVELQIPEYYVHTADGVTVKSCPEAIDELRRRILSLPPNRHLSRNRANVRCSNSYLDPANIEYGIPVPCVCRSDVQNWLKRLREMYKADNGERLKFKYFICSEYGPNTFRPHYHAIIFTNLCTSDFNKYFVQPWSDTYGNVYWKFRPVLWRKEDGVDSCMAYVAKYCSKPDFAENPYVLLGLVPKPFRLISKFIGYDYVFYLMERIQSFFNEHPDGKYMSKEFFEHLESVFNVYDGTYWHRLPRYYIDRFFPQIVEHRSYIKKNVYARNQSTYTIGELKKLSLEQQFMLYVPDLEVGDAKIIRKDSESDLWLAYKNFVVDKHTQRICELIRQIASAYAFGETVEGLDKAEAVLRENDLRAYKEKKKRLYDFYAKGFKYDY